MTTFKNIDNDKYGFYCGRKSVANDEIIDDNVYTVILKDKGLRHICIYQIITVL